MHLFNVNYWINYTFNHTLKAGIAYLGWLYEVLLATNQCPIVGQS